MIYFLRQNGKLKQIEWDAATITAGDFTVEFNIKEDGYDWWYNNVYPIDKNKGLSPGYSLKLYLKREIETLLTQELTKDLINES